MNHHHISVLLGSLLLLTINIARAEDKTIDVAPAVPPEALTSQYRQITPREISENVFKLVGGDWMLITAGTEEKFNGMTASWGGFGVWNKPVAFILVHRDRYTYEFLEREGYFTLSFFEEKYRTQLKMFGTKSGRNVDKVKEAGFTPLSMKPGMAYVEARMIVVCKKIYAERTKAESWVPAKASPTDPEKVHKLYFGEIISVWIKK